MKINSISGFIGLNSYVKKAQKSDDCLSLSKSPSYFPLRAEHFSSTLNFTGGYSVDLAQTVEKLPENVYPEGIRELAIQTVEIGNPEDKTLIDIHKEKYGKLLQMKTLDEAKAAFPEFQGVLPDNEIDYQANSFIDNVKDDKIEAFDPDIDLALQLLQMYWGEGFSLNDLKEYTEGKNIFSVLEKLNIPRLNPTYGSVLKLSNKEYNERITSLMSERQKEAAIRRAERRDGVFIPRGPLTEEHKAKIAESNKKRWAENPELAVEQSKRMKEYYREHPEEKEKLAHVLTTAWNMREARSIRKSMSKFLGKKDISAEEFARMNTEGDDNECRNLKNFWNRNQWAKASWSKCMKKAWVKVKENEKAIESPDYIIKIYPDAVKNNLLRWLRANGYEVGRITDKNLTALYYGDKPVPKSDKYAGSAISEYFNADVSRSNLMANVYHIAIMKTVTDVAFEPEFRDENGKKQRYVRFVETGLSVLTDGKGNMARELDSTEARNMYLNLVLHCYKNGETKIAQRFQDNIETAFNALQNPNNLTTNTVLRRFSILANQYGIKI